MATLCRAQQTVEPTAIKPAQGQHWVGTWATAIQAIDKPLMPPTPPGMADTTLRQVVRVSIGGKQLRVRFSNAFGPWGEGLKINQAHVAVSAGGSAIQPGTGKPLTFRGESSVTIPQGALIISDPVDFDLAPGSDLAVTIHVNDTAKDITGHRSARGKGTFLQAGNAVAATDLPQAVSTNVWYYLSGVDVLAPETSAAVICVGDSITDGKGSTEGTNRRWPDYLARRLQANAQTAQVGVLNQGIGGNCVWRGGIGQPAIVRVGRDVLAQPGARWLIVLEGINDLGGGKTTAEQVLLGLEQIVLQAKDRGLLVYGATILPAGGSGYFNPALEEKRQKINDWIRKSGAFDAVIDLDAATRDPQDPTRLLAAADSGDYLHPSDKGYKMIAEAVDLKLFMKQ
ncbi:MAG: SGNH/GDSL hydrolase family protein [Armatimonadota bacterium]|nr:SGNH/GDSL hydrolase family protein [Armatimonadota bacterium]